MNKHTEKIYDNDQRVKNVHKLAFFYSAQFSETIGIQSHFVDSLWPVDGVTPLGNIRLVTITPNTSFMFVSCVDYFECSIRGGKLFDCDRHGNLLAISFRSA